MPSRSTVDRDPAVSTWPRFLYDRGRMFVSALPVAWEKTVITIRLPKQQWGKAWRAMIEVAPVRLVANDPIYEVLPAHLELLDARGFPYEVVTPRVGPQEKRRHGTAD